MIGNNTVLLIDEVYFSRHIIKNMLLESGVTIHEAISLSDGLELFEKEAPSVIILGASYANDSGLSFAQIIKSSNVNVKIIFIFNKAVKDTVYNVYLSGGNALLVLPLSKERLLDEFSQKTGASSYFNTIDFENLLVKQD